MHPSPLPIIVLDTNVVLDWLVFADPSCTALGAAVAGRRVRWLATADMRDELAQVLARGELGRRRPDPEQVLAAWERHVEPAAPAPQLAGWRSADPDDQPFIDLAVHAGASALLTRDRALLAFARRAAAIGLVITPPSGWGPPPG